MSRKRKVAFTATTALFAVAVLPGAILDIVQPDFVVEMSQTLGLPASLLTLIGVWKLLGVAALATPGLRRVKEWAYAGFFFDLTGAAYVHAAVGDFAGVPTPLVFLCLLVASYALRSKVGSAVSPADGGASRAQPHLRRAENFS